MPICFEALIAFTTGWTNVNLLYFPDSIEIASLEVLTLQCSEIKVSPQSRKSEFRVFSIVKELNEYLQYDV